MKNTIITIIVIIIILLGGYFIIKSFSGAAVPSSNITATTTPTTSGQPSTSPQANQDPNRSVIGTSVQGNDIAAYTFGTGDTNILVVGGLHGGYEWNTVLAANQLVDYLKANPNAVPANEKITVIPVVNPDGLNKVVGTTGTFSAADVSTSQDVVVAGRFNANNVDLNRNFDCQWKSTGVWQSQTVSGGTSAFSEPETLAVKNYVEANKPAAVIALFSSAGGVYSSSCGGSVLPVTTALTNAYAQASGYPAHKTFDSYETSGDMTNWLAKNNIPAISVLLTNHTDTEWTKNLAGMQAVIKYFSK